MKNKYITFIIVFLSISILFFVGSLAKFEIQTWMRGSEFDSNQKIIYPDNKVVAGIDDADILKVMDCSDESATVYYVKKDVGGWYVDFKKTNDGWLFTSWHSVWSIMGSADDFMWPYFFHAFNTVSVGFMLFALFVNTVVSIIIVVFIRQLAKARKKRE